MPLSSNTRLGRYTIRSLLGKGGMGEVYLAQDTMLKRLVAIKLLPADFTEDRVRLRRFEREAYAASSLNHPNILTIYEIGEADGYRFIVSEYVEGESLRQHMARRRMGLKEILDTSIQVATALAAADQEGIVHRDIKPENIMLRKDGFVKVLDFGLAKLAQKVEAGHWGEADNEASTLNMTNTSPGVVIGTIAYMSPEQTRGRDVDGRSDIWSLGVVLYEMIAGSMPFSGETSNDVVAAILKTEPSPLTHITASSPPELDDIVRKMLRKGQEERYQTSKDLLSDLENLKQELDFAAKLDRPTSLGLRGQVEADGERRVSHSVQSATSINKETLTRSVSRLDWFFSGIKRHKLGTLVFAALATALVAAAFFREPFPRAEAITSVAVLPFVNGSGDQNLAYLSDGMSENLIDRLSQVPQLKVIARTSSFKFKSWDTDPKEVAHALGVQALVMGRVGKRGDDLQVRVELVDGRDKTQIWGGEFSGKAANLQTLQAEISKKISDKLRLKLGGAQQKQVTDGTPGSEEAYQLYLKGRYSWNKLTEDELKKSIDYFNQAIEKKPEYALAYAGLANSYLTLGANDLSPQETYPKAKDLARKALELDDTLAEAHYAMAATNYYYDWNLPEAERELSRTLEINPNYAMAYSLRGNLRLAKGQTNEAISQINRALDLDPFSLLFNNRLSSAYYYARDYNRALVQIKKTLELDPEASFLYSDMGMVYARLGKYEDALAACQKAIILQKDDPAALATLGITYALSHKKTEAEWIVNTLHQMAKKKYIQPFYFASIYAALGEKDQAFMWLDKARRERTFIIFLGIDPVFDQIRSDPRFNRLIESMQLQI
ncbi:hypothetical protein BH18ACI4_BH18ACI4_25880 [soil metagenome]